MLTLHNNHAAPERSIYLVKLQKLSASGERERYAAHFTDRDNLAETFRYSAYEIQKCQARFQNLNLINNF